jgi:RimJ/RimL family protein N-acetyltransferase
VIAPPPPLAPLADEAIVLRGYATTDVDDLVEKLSDPEIARWTNVPHPYLRGHAIDFLARGAEAFGERTFAIRDAHDNRMLGAIGVRLADDRSYAELGYWIAREERGRGVVTRAIGLVSDWVLGELAIPESRIYVHEANGSSLRAAEKAGYARLPGLHRRHDREGGDEFVLLTRARASAAG